MISKHLFYLSLFICFSISSCSKPAEPVFDNPVENQTNNPDSNPDNNNDDNNSSPLTLCESVDNCNFQFTTDGDNGADWIPQTSITSDGEDAAESGDIGDNQFTYIATLIDGPGTLQFSTKVDTEQGYDTLTVAVNGTEYGVYHLLTEDEKNNQPAAWYNWTIDLTEEIEYSIFWVYRKDGSISEGEDKAWVDQVIFNRSKGSFKKSNSILKKIE